MARMAVALVVFCGLFGCGGGASSSETPTQAPVAAKPEILRIWRGQALVRAEIQGWVDNYDNLHPLKYLTWKS